MIILGLTGTFGAGKSTLAEILKERGYQQLVMSDVLREELRMQGKQETRDNLFVIANELRKKYGASIIVERLVEKAQKENLKKVIIDGIRTQGEIEAIKKYHGRVIAVDSSLEIRYQRIVRRGSSKDDITFEKFKEQEKAENLQECIKKADYVIFCDGNVDDLKKEAEKMIN